MSDPAAREALVAEARVDAKFIRDSESGFYEAVANRIDRLCDLVEEQDLLLAVAPEDSMANAHGLSDRHILTVGELRSEMRGLADECTVEVAVGGAGYGDGITAESDNDGEAGWLSIFVQPPTVPAAVAGPTREELARIIATESGADSFDSLGKAGQAWWLHVADAILAHWPAIGRDHPRANPVLVREADALARRLDADEAWHNAGDIVRDLLGPALCKETTGLGSRADAPSKNVVDAVGYEHVPECHQRLLRCVCTYGRPPYADGPPRALNCSCDPLARREYHRGKTVVHKPSCAARRETQASSPCPEEGGGHE
jgi:hypothetical protein